MILFILIGFIAFVVLACGISVIATGLRYPTPPDTLQEQINYILRGGRLQ